MTLTSQTCRSCRRARGCWRGSQKRPWSFVYRRQAPRSPLHPPSSWSSTSARACPPTGMDTQASRTLQTKSWNRETTFNKGHPRVCEAAGLRLLRAPALGKVRKRYSYHSRSKVSKRHQQSGNCHPGVCVTLAPSTLVRACPHDRYVRTAGGNNDVEVKEGKTTDYDIHYRPPLRPQSR